MREGNISSEERVATLAHFVPGSGRLLLLSGGRFLFVAGGQVSFDFSDGFSAMRTNRDFFLGCIERWFASGSKPDLIAGVVEVDSTAVLAIGTLPVLVETLTNSGLVDPTAANFAAEQMFTGGLVSVSVGGLSPGNRSAELCWAANGLLPADAFVLLSSDRSFPALTVQGCSQGPTHVEPQTMERPKSSGLTSPTEARQSPDNPAPLSLRDMPDAIAIQPERNESSSTERTVFPASTVRARIDPVPDYEVFDENLDGATVWPTAGRRGTPALAPSPPIVGMPPVELAINVKEPLPSAELESTVSSADQDVQLKSIGTSAQPELDAAVDSWEPPAPEPSTFARSSPIVSPTSSPAPLTPETASLSGPVFVVPSEAAASDTFLPPVASETMTWGGPVSNEVRLPEPDSTELTIMAGDLARIRKTFVEVAPVSNESQLGTLIGVYCRAGHFTDSRSLRCLFCPEETDLDTMTSAVAPLLGVLAFDDNRVTPITSLVLVGRKPSTNDPSITAVAFGEDMMLSRVHFEVRLVDWDVSVVDKQSANGTQIEHPDGRRIVARPNIEVRLEPGSIVRFGNHQATFRRS